MSGNNRPTAKGGRPLMTVIQAQQAVIDQLRAEKAAQDRQISVQASQIAYIARLAGVSTEVQKLADQNNPAQPVPDPGEQAAPESTEQALAPTTNDDVRAPGQTGNSTEGVPAAATDTPIQPGGTIPTQPFNNLIDVTAPTAGTNTGEVPLEQTRIETDVRTLPDGPGGQMNPEVAFPWTVSPNESNSAPPADGEMGGAKQASANHDFATCMRLARLRLQAGLAQGDDVTIASQISTDATLTPKVIRHEINTLTPVVAQLQAARQAAETPLPRTAAKTRTAPSLASAPHVGTAAAGGGLSDSDLFLTDLDLSGL